MELPEVNISGEKKLPIKQVIFALIILIIIGEIIWVGWSLYNSVYSKAAEEAGSGSSTTEILATLSLKANKTAFSVGEKIPVEIIGSSVRNTDGVDVVIYYDPELLSVDVPENAPPVTTGLIYSDYPINRVDSENSRVEYSGITVNQNGVRLNGTLGTLVFTAKAPGKTTIRFDFTQGSTTDSNIAETKTSEDILGKVEDLEITIK